MWKHWINVFLGILIGVGAFWLNFNLFWLFVLGALASLLASAAFEKKKDFWAWLQLISALLVLLAAIVGSILRDRFRVDILGSSRTDHHLQPCRNRLSRDRIRTNDTPHQAGCFVSPKSFIDAHIRLSYLLYKPESKDSRPKAELGPYT